MKRELAHHIHTAQALVALMHPHVEVVIHDLKSGTIAGIYNNFSGRKIGDPSYVDHESSKWQEAPDHFPPYIKVGNNGARIKSTTAVIRDVSGKAVGLFCVNLDLSPLDSLKSFTDSFSSDATELPKELFKDDWREKLNQYIHSYTKDRGLRIDKLNRKQRLDLIKKLHTEGALTRKHAAEHIAVALGVSRATLYKDLAQVRK